MSGTLVINEQVCWVSPGWLFDNVLEEIALALDKTDRELARRVREGTTEANGMGFLDLSDWTPADKAAFAKAVPAAIDATLERGAAGLVVPEGLSPSVFPKYVEAMRDLVDLLRMASEPLA